MWFTNMINFHKKESNLNLPKVPTAIFQGEKF